jgi:hypothetical protein
MRAEHLMWAEDPMWTENPHDWLDADAGPVVRPYALTGGRARAAPGLDLVAYVVATDVHLDPTLYLAPEHRQILAAAREPVAVAELAGRLNLALGVVRVLLGDLLAEGLVTMHEPDDPAAAPDDPTLEAVINGLRAL